MKIEIDDIATKDDDSDDGGDDDDGDDDGDGYETDLVELRQQRRRRSRGVFCLKKNELITEFHAKLVSQQPDYLIGNVCVSVSVCKWACPALCLYVCVCLCVTYINSSLAVTEAADCKWPQKRKESAL